jgi:hypothetical protein
LEQWLMAHQENVIHLFFSFISFSPLFALDKVNFKANSAKSKDMAKVAANFFLDSNTEISQ